MEIAEKVIDTELANKDKQAQLVDKLLKDKFFMKSGRAALRYAKALLDFSIEGQEEKNVFDEMQNILSVMQSSKDLNDVLNNPVLPTKQKRHYQRSF